MSVGSIVLRSIRLLPAYAAIAVGSAFVVFAGFQFVAVVNAIAEWSGFRLWYAIALGAGLFAICWVGQRVTFVPTSYSELEGDEFLRKVRRRRGHGEDLLLTYSRDREAREGKARLFALIKLIAASIRWGHDVRGNEKTRESDKSN